MDSPCGGHDRDQRHQGRVTLSANTMAAIAEARRVQAQDLILTAIICA